MFNSENIITEHISKVDFKTYLVGFDLNVFRYDHLIEYLLDALVDFSFGYYTGILKTYV